MESIRGSAGVGPAARARPSTPIRKSGSPEVPVRPLGLGVRVSPLNQFPPGNGYAHSDRAYASTRLAQHVSGVNTRVARSRADSSSAPINSHPEVRKSGSPEVRKSRYVFPDRTYASIRLAHSHPGTDTPSPTGHTAQTPSHSHPGTARPLGHSVRITCQQRWRKPGDKPIQRLPDWQSVGTPSAGTIELKSTPHGCQMVPHSCGSEGHRHAHGGTNRRLPRGPERDNLSKI
jgi:hypothetical protein